MLNMDITVFTYIFWFIKMKLGPYEDIKRKFRPTVLPINPRILYDLALALRILLFLRLTLLNLLFSSVYGILYSIYPT